MQLGEAWLQFTYWIVGSKLYSNWQSLAQERFGSGKKDDILWLFVRSFAYGYVLFHIFRFLKRKVSRLLGYGPLYRDPNLQKLRRVVYLNFYFCNFYVNLFYLVALIKQYMFLGTWEHCIMLHFRWRKMRRKNRTTRKNTQ